MEVREMKKIVILCLIGLFVLAGCATAPITGRSQINIVSDQQLIATANENFSQFMALLANKNAVLLPSESSDAAATLAYVNRVSERIIDASGLRNRLNWQTVVVKSSNANAFVLPNGKIVVFTGILPLAKTEAGLATVIGHEVAHVAARHKAERMSQALLAKAALTAVEVALAASNSKYRPIIGAALGLGALYGVLMPFSRIHELEADRIGLFYMAKAGYDPTEAIGFWERMEAAGRSGPWELLSTHPNPGTRRSNIREWLPEANLYYANHTRPLPVNLSEVKAARAEQYSRAALAPVIAYRPSFEPGFWYQIKSNKFSKPVTYRFDRREKCSTGECMIIVGDRGDVTIYTADHGLVEIRDPNGSWVHFSPPLRIIRFPLRVGDSWTDAVTVEDPSGRRQNVQLKADVVDYESVTVPSGSFMAFKIIVSLRGVRFSESWYAPETRTSVRNIIYDPRGGQIVGELVDYYKTDEPVDPMNANPE
jgi:Zn-dependent protease with chaperone function